MKYLFGFLRLWLFLMAFTLELSGARAQSGIDPAARDALINKLSQVYLNLAPKDSSKVAVTLRLADLHAEKARVLSLKELSDGCVKCVAGKEDRLKALRYYNEVLHKVPESSVGKVLTQIGHLYEMTGNEREAIETYERIISENKVPEAVTEAHLSLGELFFKKRSFESALPHFQKVIESKHGSSQGLASYKVAWCLFNDGKLEPAIAALTKLLRTPALLARGASGDGTTADKQFQEEVSRDLATFLSRRPVSVRDAELVYELSPEQAKLANVTYLAGEAERLGQVQGAIAIWRMAQERQTKPQVRLEGHVHLAQLQMTQKLLADAVKDFEMALALWSQLGECSEGQCKELKARLRNFVVDWNRVEKKAPTEQLLSAYQSYLKVFPRESDMILGAAKVAADVKQYGLSVEMYLSGSKMAAESSDKEAVARVEPGLLGAIEAAELSKEPALLNNAYDGYLSLSRERKRALDVQYQKARLVYDRGEHAAAAEALRAVAYSRESAKESTSVALKKQAAELSLDALVLLKDDARLEKWASEYSKTFPGEQREFAAIARKSVLTQSAAVAGTATPEALATAWATLARFDLASASPEDKIAYYKNKLILAEKTRRFGDAREAAESLLHQPGLSETDRQYALSRKAWLAELALDFETALVATEKVSTGETSQRWLKLAMYAELASRDARPYLTEFLKQSKDDDKNAAIAAQLVRSSRDPLKEIDLQKTSLAKRPELLAELFLEAFAKQPTPEVAKRALQSPQVAAAASGKVIARAIFIGEVESLRAKITAHQLDASTQKKMAQTLKTRVALLADTEKLASRAVTSGDWTSQLVILDLLAKQSDRFYQEILSLPVPAGLSAEDEQQYLSLLSQQAAPHQTRASDVAKKVTEFWANPTAMTQLAESMDKEMGPRRALLSREIQALVAVAPDAEKSRLQEIAAKPEPKKEVPTLVALEGARQSVRESPLDKTRLESLLALERKLGRQSMVAYLEGRIQLLSQAEDPK